MYSKAEVAERRQAFWTAFGQYMTPVPTATGERVHWINYRTGIKHIQFRMHADQRRASIAVEITHPDAELRAIYFAELQTLRPVLEEAVGEEWIWDADASDEYGRERSRVYQEMTGVNLFERDDWPRLISFFKPRLIGLDAFWAEAQPVFEALQ
jgi:Domain of unknown function (DUF4268)